MSKSKQSYYMIIPASVWDSDLNPNAKLLYGHITVLANKDGYCFAGNKYFEKALRIKSASVSRYLNELEEMGIIKREFIYRDGTKEIEKRKIYLNTPVITGDNTCYHEEQQPVIKDDNSPVITSDSDNNTSNNNTSINNIDDVYGKLFFKLVDMYPKNRIGNRQHNLKKFKELSLEECKLSLKNLKRYLDVAQGYNKSLSNYITEKVFTEEWLAAEEETKLKKKGITDKPDTKTFNTDYDNF